MFSTEHSIDYIEICIVSSPIKIIKWVHPFFSQLACLSSSCTVDDIVVRIVSLFHADNDVNDIIAISTNGGFFCSIIDHTVTTLSDCNVDTQLTFFVFSINMPLF